MAIFVTIKCGCSKLVSQVINTDRWNMLYTKKCFFTLFAVTISLLTACDVSAPKTLPPPAISFQTAVLPPTLSPTPAPPTPTPFPTFTPTPLSGSFENPYKIGTFAKLIRTVDKTDVAFDIRVIKVLRGNEAWQLIYRANSFNKRPAQGLEYVLIDIEVHHVGQEKVTVTMTEVQVSTASNGRIFNTDLSYYACCLDKVGMNSFNLTLLPNTKLDGWVGLPVYIDDPKPLMVFGLRRDGTGGFYFALTP